MIEELDRINRALGDRYLLVREVGAGGVATVYMGRDLKHGRPVAVKVLHPELAGSITAARFLREIEITSSLTHPNIVPLFDSGEKDGYVFFVMPHQEARSLAHRLREEGALPIEEAVRIACEIAEALAYAHQHGVVHRDVKPSNVLLSEGHAMVADFGIARAVQTSVTGGLTLSGASVGTPVYMSPEQAAADHRIDERADIYSLGCVLYEMLAGHPPFQASTSVALAAQHLKQPPPSLRTIRPAVSEDLQAVVETALAKLPADRFPSAASFVEALRESPTTTTKTRLHHSTFSAHGDARSARPRGWSALRTTRVAGFVTVVVLALLAARHWARAPTLPLARDKIVVFPLVDRGGDPDDGWDVALVIELALEHTDPLKWIDGWTLLDPAVRSDPSRLPPSEARVLARGRQAAFYILGTVLHRGDSVSVTLILNDTQADSIVARATATGGGTSPDQLGLQAVVQLLPPLVDPGGSVDAAYLLNRNPRAVATWIQGEREYRQARFGAALELFERAVAADSLLALAALRGAQAADWATHDPELGETLARVALRHAEYLPPRHRSLARGFVAYVEGRADDAVAEFRSALAEDPDWSEAWMLLGEVYHHLLPSDVAGDSPARDAFAEAHARDPRFGPAIIHLAELAIPEQDHVAMREIREALDGLDLEAGQRLRLGVMDDCVRSGPARVDWQRAVQQGPAEVLSAGTMLAAGGLQMPCAEAAFRSILAGTSVISPAVRYGATLGLEAVLVATGRGDEAGALVESAIPWADTGVIRVLLVHAAGGANFGGRDETGIETLRRELGTNFPGSSWRTLWAVGAWDYARGDTAALVGVEAKLAALEASDPDAARVDTLVAARLWLARGDTARAIRALEGARSRAPAETLAWDEQEALPTERLLLARLLLAEGRAEEALGIANVFDHSWPITFVAFLPESLAVRRDAARTLGRPDLVAMYTRRIDALARAGAAPSP